MKHTNLIVQFSEIFTRVDSCVTTTWIQNIFNPPMAPSCPLLITILCPRG